MKEDITNRRFGRLIAIKRTSKIKTGGEFWLCQCDCGNIKEIRRQDLTRKPIGTQSCGCLAKEIKTKRFTKHGLAHSQLFKVWDGMKYRTNPNAKMKNRHYKENHITVCDEWRNDFQAFYDWAMESGYKEERLSNGRNRWTIDRIDNTKGYSPDNCRWVDMKIQSNNRSSNIFITYNGETKTLAQWSEELGIKADTIASRMKRGYSFERAIKEPIDKLVRYEYKGKFLTRAEMSAISGLPISCIQNRLQKGWDINRVMEQPIKENKRTKSL